MHCLYYVPKQCDKNNTYDTHPHYQYACAFDFVVRRNRGHITSAIDVLCGADEKCGGRMLEKGQVLLNLLHKVQ